MPQSLDRQRMWEFLEQGILIQNLVNGLLLKSRQELATPDCRIPVTGLLLINAHETRDP